MNSYMVDIDLPDALNRDFIQRIPEQRALVKTLMRKGVISNYSLSHNRKKLWVVIHAENKDEVRTILGSFPIFKYISYRINSLLFHETQFTSLPQMWLN